MKWPGGGEPGGEEMEKLKAIGHSCQCQCQCQCNIRLEILACPPSLSYARREDPIPGVCPLTSIIIHPLYPSIKPALFLVLTSIHASICDIQRFQHPSPLRFTQSIVNSTTSFAGYWPAILAFSGMPPKISIYPPRGRRAHSQFLA